MTTIDQFDALEICDNMKNAIKEMGFERLTEIQLKSIPYLLDGKDMVGSAKTGSGKTLAFLIPAIELLHKLEFTPEHGSGVIVISPTRELSIQTFGVLKELIVNHKLTYGLIMGGASRTTEARKLANGINILVATPGRLLDHLKSTPNFLYRNLQCLVIDEADRILDIGFEEDLKEIIKLLPKKRQSMLFSATLSDKTQNLTAIALKKEPIYVSVDENKETATVSGLEQAYAIVPTEKRFLLLYTFLKKNRKKKVMVFFSSCMSVKFHCELLNYIDLPVMSIHGRQKQSKRTATFFSFCNAENGILLCTDVAARGLDIPAVDWIVQYDPPDDPKEYIHRVGRTARGINGKGNAMLFLRVEEVAFVKYLKDAKVPLWEAEFQWNKIANIQPQLDKLMSQNYFLNQSSKEAFKAYVRAYVSHHLKHIFNIETLDMRKVAASFGLQVPPAMDLDYHSDKPTWPSRKRGGGGYGHLKDMNQNVKRLKKTKMYKPVKQKNDNRQFSK